MKKAILSIVLFVTALSTFATNYEVSCRLKDDFDDWYVYVADDKANFFDNDSHYGMKFWSVSGESWVYYDSNDFETLTFYFNQASMEGTLIIDSERNDDGATFYEMYCEYETIDWL